MAVGSSGSSAMTMTFIGPKARCGMIVCLGRSSATIKDCHFEDNLLSNVYMSEGACADLTADCIISRSKGNWGLWVYDNSCALAAKCAFKSNMRCNVHMIDGAHIVLLLRVCNISRSMEGHFVRLQRRHLQQCAGEHGHRVGCASKPCKRLSTSGAVK